MTDLCDYTYQYSTRTHYAEKILSRFFTLYKKKSSLTDHHRSCVLFLSSYFFIMLVGAGILNWHPLSSHQNIGKILKAAEESELVLSERNLNLASLGENNPAKILTTGIAVEREERYSIKQGDSLSLIAARYEISPITLALYNGIISKSDIRKGRILKIPESEGTFLALNNKKQRDQFIIDNPEWSSYIKRLVKEQAEEAFIPGIIPSLEVSKLNLESWFLLPLAGSITGEFGSRKDPLTGLQEYRNGVEITSLKNDQVRAAANGVVSEVGYNKRYGNYLIMRHSGRFHSFYAGLGEIKVSNGQTLDVGDLLGYMEKDKNRTLHFSIFKDKKVVDPINHLF